MAIASRHEGAFSDQATYVERFAAIPESVRAARNAIVDFASAAGVSAERVEDVRLAVSEATTNVVRHAYTRAVTGGFRILATVDDDHLLVIIEDDGRGLHARSPQPGLGAGQDIMRKVADEALFIERVDGSTVELRFDLA